MRIAGFTMVELVFGVVIVGIIASVTTTKLTATRYDPKISIELTNITTCIKDLGAQYDAAVAFDPWKSPACVTTYNNGNGCLIHQPKGDGTVTIVSNTQNTEPWCAEVQTLAEAKGLITTFTFGGVIITR